MNALLYSPPFIFCLFFFGFLLTSRLLHKYANKEKPGERALAPYACGQRDVENYVNPNYSQYFTYAFIFTVVHILILVVATAPKDVQIMPIAYIISGMLAILIAFKR